MAFPPVLDSKFRRETWSSVRGCARSLGARTNIRNLYLTGQDAGTAGVTGALFGGVITASLVLGRNLMSKVTRPIVYDQRTGGIIDSLTVVVNVRH